MTTSTRKARQRLLAPGIAATVVLGGTVLGGTPVASADEPASPVTAWVRQHATPLATVDPRAPIDDLAVLRRSVGGAEIVGLGESVHGAAEEITLKHRALRFLVERMGFRSIAWEEDWTMGVRIDRYIRGDDVDLATLMRRVSEQWRFREVANVLRWLRDYNAGRADKVRFFGVEYYLTRRRAYDAVEAYVARTAPTRLPELRRHLRPIRPYLNINKYRKWYETVPNKRPLIRHARHVHRLVAGLPHRGSDAYARTLHHTRQIVSFYVHYALPMADNVVYRERRAAENLRWWRDHSGDRIAYWAASPHVANAPRLRIVFPGGEMRFPSTGSYLRRWYHDRYRPIGFTFDHGRVRLGPGDTAPMPRPKARWFERPFGQGGAEQFALDLRTRPAPPPVRRWLERPVRTRGLAHTGPDSYLAGGSLAQWFDVVVHRQRITPVRPLEPTRVVSNNSAWGTNSR
jgi:erythromycin esterase-like protein